MKKKKFGPLKRVTIANLDVTELQLARAGYAEALTLEDCTITWCLKASCTQSLKGWGYCPLVELI